VVARNRLQHSTGTCILRPHQPVSPCPVTSDTSIKSDSRNLKHFA
jgi:hypothetical protein